MNGYDPQMAQRVWQRVQGSAVPEAPAQALLTHIATALADAALCRQLTARFHGSRAAVLQRVAQEKAAHAQCLKGIFRLLTGTAADLQAAAPALTSTEAALQHCLGNTLRSIRYYRQWQCPEDFSSVISHLAQKETSLAQVLLALLGSIN